MNASTPEWRAFLEKHGYYAVSFLLEPPTPPSLPLLKEWMLTDTPNTLAGLRSGGPLGRRSHRRSLISRRMSACMTVQDASAISNVGVPVLRGRSPSCGLTILTLSMSLVGSSNW